MDWWKDKAFEIFIVVLLFGVGFVIFEDDIKQLRFLGSEI